MSNRSQFGAIFIGRLGANASSEMCVKKKVTQNESKSSIMNLDFVDMLL